MSARAGCNVGLLPINDYVTVFYTESKCHHTDADQLHSTIGRRTTALRGNGIHANYSTMRTALAIVNL